MAPRLLRYESLTCRMFGTRLARHVHQQSSISPVTVISQSHDRISVEEFRRRALETETPLCMKAGSESTSLPAIKKWFQPLEGDIMQPSRRTATSYLEGFSMTLLPYELLHSQSPSPDREAVQQLIQELASHDTGHEPSIFQALGKHLLNQLPRTTNSDTQKPEQTQHLFRFDAPLALLLAASDRNSRIEQEPATGSRGLLNPQHPVRNLYVAQAPINELPEALRQDVPASEVVKRSGRGDIYDSSIWLGLEPTYTPLHRDPNPNLFVQLCSSKVVRLLPPTSGDHVFYRVQQRLGRSSGNSRIRGAEMMQGLERAAFYEAVWGPRDQPSLHQDDDDKSKLPMQEATLGPGDALYIPKGWWHSVKSVFSDGRLNGSVNWWFR